MPRPPRLQLACTSWLVEPVPGNVDVIMSHHLAFSCILMYVCRISMLSG
jgi:hypothetical protein